MDMDVNFLEAKELPKRMPVATLFGVVRVLVGHGTNSPILFL